MEITSRARYYRMLFRTKTRLVLVSAFRTVRSGTLSAKPELPSWNMPRITGKNHIRGASLRGFSRPDTVASLQRGFGPFRNLNCVNVCSSTFKFYSGYEIQEIHLQFFSEKETHPKQQLRIPGQGPIVIFRGPLRNRLVMSVCRVTLQENARRVKVLKAIGEKLLHCPRPENCEADPALPNSSPWGRSP